MRPQQSVALLALCGAVVLGGGAALRLAGPGSSTTENAETASVETTRRATSLLGLTEPAGAPPATTTAAVSASDVATAAPAEAELTIKSAGAPASGGFCAAAGSVVCVSKMMLEFGNGMPRIICASVP